MNLKTPHLTHDQLCDLLLEPSLSSAAAEPSSPAGHLRDCPLCAAELASLRDGLHGFRDTTKAWASHTMASRSWSPSAEISPRRLFEWQFLWASALLLFAAAIPLTFHYRQAHSQSTESVLAEQSSHQQSSQIGDEALLEEINQTLSSSVPTPMQPLADPTAGRSSQNNSTTRKN